MKHVKNVSGKSILRGIAAAATAAAMALSLSACSWFNTQADNPNPSNSGSTSENKGPITVVASLNQWGSLAKEIGGDDVEVTSILNSTTADAHDFEPTAKDVAKIQDAQVVVANGAGYDDWATKNLGKNATVVSAAQIVGAVEGDNAHLWFSNNARSSMASSLAETFSQLRPADKDTFTKNLDAWKKSESALEDNMKALTKETGKLPYAATENVAAYLMSDLDYENKTPKGFEQAVQSEGEPAPADIKAFQDLLKNKEVKLFIENPQEKTDMSEQLEALAKENNIPVLNITEQMPSDQKDLNSWIQSIIDQLGKDFAAGSGENADKD